MIEYKNVSKKYPGGKNALEKISFEIQNGEFVYLIGPSGAGKTTILKLLFGDTKPSGGKVLYGGHPVHKFSGKNIAILRRKIRMVFQDFKVLTDRTVLENVLISLYIVGRSDREATAEAMKALKLVGLPDKAQFFPVQLSAGELQRVAIARALAGGSEVILADEPTGNLDPKTGEEIMDLLEEINKEGTTIIVTTHNAALVDRAKKRVIQMKDGQVVRDDKEGKYDPTS
ncbi:cell division ATP-binding protein FtsE [Candidatus Roizmanbacteria bacterium RIFCSPLOWO2_01_FULL_45_11]|uniref:Cell division ATP-binding protein FtsE n=1 Tax=Candidatus Roizmanbacteria bacterium RIFCSPLOWO2_01_FULL_45_11 TaxID=1802070 RepID=A0A1F7JFK6_9BACT|nr:MAG: cell division ATP-binding protein FtsE [Candidatus Roizmanbacteria bacterium RIFCSPLOWO2_01_FULL_45_11]